ncbi:MAG: hypothetical protein KAX49_08080 [Halanaerobiales bacterium]|nr:hypothetical protein [Halanaerobiales bacterium]
MEDLKSLENVMEEILVMNTNQKNKTGIGELDKSEARVLVPIMVEAILVNKDSNSQEYVDLTPNFDLLEMGEVLGEKMVNEPFTTTTHLNPGIHLHWALPDALTHGIQTKEGEMEYPAVPNRWFILRIHTDQGKEIKSKTYNPKMSLKAWVVESDYMYHEYNPDEKESISVPTLNSGNEEQLFMYLGKAYEYADWNPSNPGLYLEKLTAIGPGDPLFAAFYPNCKSVFGFHDDDICELSDGTITYMVAGWYSKQENDPLNGLETQDEWKAMMDQLNWGVSDTTGIFLTQTLCHGMIFNIPWKGKDGTYSNGTPAGELDIAVGNSSVEALSALLEFKVSDNTNLARLMEVFQYDLLSEWEHPDGIADQEEKIHEKAFGSKKGGIRWIIRKTSEETKNESSIIPDSIGKLLNILNVSQKKYENLNGELASLQWETYSAWYKYISTASGPSADSNFISEADIIKVIDLLGKKIESVRREVTDEESSLNKLISNLEAKIAKLLPEYKLDQVSGARFWQANNPVLLFAGSNLQRSFKHGFDGRFTEEGKLECRVSEQTIYGLAISPVCQEVVVKGDNFLPFYLKFPEGKRIPTEIQSIFIETIFLDPNQAVPIAIAAYRLSNGLNPNIDQVDELASKIKKIQTVPWNSALYRDLSSQKLANAAGLKGIIPSKIGVEPWKYPWTPLFMEWEVEFIPTCIQDDIQNVLKNWELGDVDYTWQGENPPKNKSQLYRGSILLTPSATIHLNNTLKKHLDSYNGNDVELSSMRNMVNEIANLNILSQTISGFNDALLMRKQTLQFPVFDPYYNTELAQRVSDLVNGMNDVAPQTEIIFNPIRAGFMKISRIWIVDAFGQIQNVTINSPYPIKSKSLTTTGDDYKELITVPPRITQPGRLLFKWLSAKDDSIETNLDPATSPICGWILPNYVDRSLMVYDALGVWLGFLQIIYSTEGNSNVRWVETPGIQKTSGELPEIKDQNLKDFITEILEYGKKDVPILDELLKYFDKVLGSIESASEQQQNLSVLIGRPLALVRASLKLELDGLPAYNQSYDYLGKYVTNGFENVQFPVRLGDVNQLSDGLTGYFIDHGENTYKTFYATSGYSSKINSNSYIDYHHEVLMTCHREGKPTMVTLLVDPNAGIHITSGILPTKYVTLPDEHISKVLAAMNIAFRVEPLISHTSTLSLPLPAVKDAQWSWVSQSENTVNEIQNASEKARLSPGQQEIYEGWLKMKNIKISENEE